MNLGLSDRIRALAQSKYVGPAIQAGKRQISIRVRDLLNDLAGEGFPGGHTPQICSAIQTTKFLRENGLEIEEVEGPPSKMSPTVVVRYRVAETRRHAHKFESPTFDRIVNTTEEDPAARAKRLSEKLRGVLKEELAEYGGGEAFLRWVRSENEDEA